MKEFQEEIAQLQLGVDNLESLASGASGVSHGSRGSNVSSDPKM